VSVPSLRLDQRAGEAYPAVNSNNPNSHDFSHGSDYSGKTAAEIRTLAGSDFLIIISEFWSSSTQSDNTDNAWNVNFNNGNVNNNNKTNNNNVRCVR